VNCFNHQLAVDKHTKKAVEEGNGGQALTLSTFAKDNCKERDASKREALKVNEFNLRRIQENQQKRNE
jgi:hypothetical protein